MPLFPLRDSYRILELMSILITKSSSPHWTTTVARIPQSTRLSRTFIVMVETRTSAFKLSTCLRGIIRLMLSLGYPWKPSRKCSDLDCMLSIEAWLSLERLFGPHSFDLMFLCSPTCGIFLGQ